MQFAEHFAWKMQSEISFNTASDTFNHHKIIVDNALAALSIYS